MNKICRASVGTENAFIALTQSEGLMKKTKSETQVADKESVLEIIELAANDFATLAKAFNLIADVCSKEEIEDSSLDESFEEYIH